MNPSFASKVSEGRFFELLQDPDLQETHWNQLVRIVLAIPPGEGFQWAQVVPRDLDQPVDEEAIAAWLSQAPFSAIHHLQALFAPSGSLPVSRERLLSLVAERRPEGLLRFFHPCSPPLTAEIYLAYLERLVDVCLARREPLPLFPWGRERWPESASAAERSAAGRYLRGSREWIDANSLHEIRVCLVTNDAKVDPRVREAYADALVACASRAKAVRDFDPRFLRVLYEFLDAAQIMAFVRAFESRPKLICSALSDVETNGGATGAAALAWLAEGASLPKEAAAQLATWKRKRHEVAALPKTFQVRSFEEVVADFEELGFATGKRPPKLRRGRNACDTFDFASYSPKADKEESWGTRGRVVGFASLYLGAQGPWTPDQPNGLGHFLERVADMEAVLMKGRGTRAHVTWLSQPGDYLLANLNVFPPPQGDEPFPEEHAVVGCWRVSEGWAYAVMVRDQDSPWRLRRLLKMNYPVHDQQFSPDQVLGTD